jgi:tape measure domain-containing protein
MALDPTINIKVNTAEAERALGRLNSAIGALGFGLSAAGAIAFADSVTNVNNKLKQVTGTGAEFARVQKQLYTIANQTGSAIADTTTLYQKMSLAQDTAGLTSAGVIKMTELVSKQMATVGMNTAETNSFLTQFGQAMASGRLQGDEFRSMMETNVPMMKMLANSMGVTIGELKNLGSEGKITAKDLTDAFIGSTDAIEKAAANIDMTISKAFVVLKNNAMQAFGEMESGSIVVKGITEAILLLANNLTEAIRLAIAFVVALAVSKLASIARGVDGISGAFATLNKTIRANLFVALITAIVYVGEKIYSDIIKPLKDAGITSGVIGRYIAQNLLNAFFQVSEYLLSWAPATGKLILDSLTPGKSIKESWNEVMAIQDKILTKERFKFVTDEELKSINKALEGQKKVTEAVKEQTDLRKEAQTALSQQQKEAQKALDAYIKGLQRSGVEQQDLVLYGKREAEVRKAIQEQQDKLQVVGQSLSKNQREQIVNAIRLKQEYEDIATTQQAFKTVAQQITLNSIEDVRQRQIQQGLLQYQATVSKEIYAANAGNYESLLKQAQLTDDLNQYKVTMRDIDLEIANLQIKDVREREIQNELTQLQLQLGREVFAITGKQLEAKVRERNLQKLINEELGKARNLTLGTFGNLALEIKKTEEAYAGARKEAARVWKEISKGKDMDEALAKSQQDRMLLEKSQAIQTLQLEAEKFRLIGFYQGEAFNLREIEYKQIEALRETDLLDVDKYEQAKANIELRYMEQMAEARKKDIEQQTRLRLAADGNIMGGIKLTTEEQKKIAGERAAFEMKTDYQKTQFMVENASTIFNALGAQNKKAFDAAKALNIATAIMNTYRGATIALATYPPPFNFIAAAAVVAAGLAQVAAIRSQTYSGRALGGGVMGGTSYIVGERGPELFTPTNSGKITRNQDLAGGGSTTVNFTVVANDTRGFDELLTARKGLITQIIQDAQLEKGRRI